MMMRRLTRGAQRSADGAPPVRRPRRWGAARRLRVRCPLRRHPRRAPARQSPARRRHRAAANASTISLPHRSPSRLQQCQGIQAAGRRPPPTASCARRRPCGRRRPGSTAESIRRDAPAPAARSGSVPRAWPATSSSSISRASDGCGRASNSFVACPSPCRRTITCSRARSSSRPDSRRRRGSASVSPLSARTDPGSGRGTRRPRAGSSARES